MDSTNTTQNIISYCTGMRGIERGLERSGLPTKTIAFLEIEAFIVGNLVAQMEAGLLAPAPVWTNIKTFDARPFRNKIHGIIGGYPCQPFSHAGERKGVEDERHLWPYILEHIKIIRPEWCYFENVGGHLSMGYEEVRRSLSDIGYRVEEGIFTAEEVGAPHRRERLFILATMENASIFGWRRGIIGHKSKGCEPENKIKRSGTSLADTNVDDTGTNPGYVSKQERESIGEAYKRKRDRDESGPCDTTMDDGVVQRLQRHSGNDSGKGRWSKPERPVTEASLFPLGQGVGQHDWEEHRTIESSLEYTIDGYNFTEDLHRAIGNSVVEQVAELAFLSLLDKHLANL